MSLTPLARASYSRFDFENPQPTRYTRLPAGSRAMSIPSSDGGWVNGGYWRRALPGAD